MTRNSGWVARLGLVTSVLAVLALAVAAPLGAGGVPKVTICHIPPGNPDNAHEITVGLPAVVMHVLLHGDLIGSCEEEEEEEEEE